MCLLRETDALIRACLWKIEGQARSPPSRKCLYPRATAAAEIPTTLEPAGLCLSNGRRPDGQTLLPWSRERPLAWGYTRVHRFAASYARTAFELGRTVAEFEEKKMKTYAD